ncbi:hypothetical protein N7499_004659 [Penicillium canescens]|nr:hypothetical protein N7522_004955 [Penicillium canescens]KAJ6085030.1 hypothetical protein N7499_004659 [Penicillium canescens]KAJ6161817.1 hypothetical protein N7485_010047 [Penicillium canescens]
MPLHRPVPTTTYRLPGTAAEQDSRQMRPTTNQHLNTRSPLPLPTKSSGAFKETSSCSSGIGFATVNLLARRGARVYFTTRFESQARKTKEKLQNTHPDINPNNIEWLLLDLTDLKSIDTAAHELKK